MVAPGEKTDPTRSSASLVMLADRAGRITLAAGDGLSVLGLRGADLEGRPAPEGLRSWPALERGIEEALRERTSTTRLSADGHRLEVQFSPRHDARGELAGALVSAVDLEAIDKLAREVRSHDRHLQLVFGQIPGAIWATDRELVVSYAIGKPPPEIGLDTRSVVGRSVWDIVGTRDPSHGAVAHHLAALAGSCEQFRLEFRGRWFQILIQPLRDESHAVVGCVAAGLDVTNQERTLHDLARSVSLLQATLEATADGLLVVDRQGKLVVFNQRFLDLWGIPESLVTIGDDRRLLDFVENKLETPSEFMRGVHELYAHPETENFTTLYFKDGRVLERYSRPQKIGDETVGRVWSFRDVTDRERLLRRATFLSDATRLLHSLDMTTAVEGVARLSVPTLGDGCAVDLLGLGGPRRLLALSHDRTRPIDARIHPAVLDGHPTIYEVEDRSYMGVPLFSARKVVGTITFANAPARRYTLDDLSLAEELARRIALSIENANAYQQARQALLARDEFLTIAAHEMRGPVTALHLAVQSLRGQHLTPEHRDQILRVIEREDRRLTALVDELVDVGRVRTGRLQFEIEPVDLADVVRQVASDKGPDLTKSGSSLSIKTSGKIVGEWDAFRVEQIVSNLVSNAIKFGLGKEIVLDARVDDDHAILSVRDHGIGIPAEALHQVFEPFERTVSARHYGGLGLGLYIARQIAQGFGGTLTVESQEGRGSTFTLRLPLRRQP